MHGGLDMAVVFADSKQPWTEKERCLLPCCLEPKCETWSTLHLMLSLASPLPCSCPVVLTFYMLCSLLCFKVLEGVACVLHFFEPFHSG